MLEKLAYLRNTSPSVDKLQVLGKRAAGRFLGGDADNLTDAVRDVVSDQDLNKEQISRVAQFTNQSTWKSSFVEGGDVNARFAPADSSQVIDSLTDRGHVQSTEGVSDYYSTPDNTWRESFDLDEILESFGEEKVASNLLNPSYQAEKELRLAEQKVKVCETALNEFNFNMRDTAESFYDSVKQAHLGEGAGIAQMADALHWATGSEKWACAVMTSCKDRLIHQGVVIDGKEEMRKLASPSVMNVEHPVILEGLKFYKIASMIRNANKEYFYAKKELEEKKRSLLKGVTS